MIDVSDEWIYKRTGIRERRIAEENTTAADLGTYAAKNLIRQLQLDPLEVELLLVGTLSPPHFFPATACLIQERLGAKKAAAFDINAGCSGGTHTLITAANYILNGFSTNALVIATDVATQAVDWRERGVSILLGDGASAIYLNTAGPLRIRSFLMGSDGSLADAIVLDAIRPSCSFENKIIKPHFIRMKGRIVFEFAVKRLPPLIREALASIGKEVRDLDLFIPHQANNRIIEAITERLGLPREKVFSHIEKLGNTSSAATLLAFADAWAQGRIHSGMTILLAAFGAGMTWSIIVLES